MTTGRQPEEVDVITGLPLGEQPDALTRATWEEATAAPVGAEESYRAIG